MIQSVYLNERGDVPAKACSAAQLKYRNAAFRW
jgi:hypothetical protein